MHAPQKIATGVATVGLATILAACGSSSGGGGNPGSSSPASEPASSSPASSSASAKPVGQFKTLTCQSTTVQLDSGFVQALGSLKVTPGVTGNAKADLSASPATVSFPITGGNATIYKKGTVTPYVQGTIEHNGSGLTLSAGGTTVGLSNFVVDPGNNSKLTGKVTANGKTVGTDVKLFDLDGTTLQTPTISSSGVATLQGTTVYLSTDAAALLNKTFKVNALKGGDKTGTKIGVAVIKATGK